MTLKQMHCPILQAQVTVVTDLEGAVDRVICPQYVESVGGCRLKSQCAVGGPLSRLLERVSENTLASRGDRCEVHG
jgi:hypothetical protein